MFKALFSTLRMTAWSLGLFGFLVITYYYLYSLVKIFQQFSAFSQSPPGVALLLIYPTLSYAIYIYGRALWAPIKKTFFPKKRKISSQPSIEEQAKNLPYDYEIVAQEQALETYHTLRELGHGSFTPVILTSPEHYCHSIDGTFVQETIDRSLKMTIKAYMAQRLQQDKQYGDSVLADVEVGEW